MRTACSAADCLAVAILPALVWIKGTALAFTGPTAVVSSGPAASSVYVNLPFCRRRCFYCDFPIKVLGDRRGAAGEAAKPYVDKVLSEIRTTARCLGKGHTDSTPVGVRYDHGSEGVATIFFGGGTPSLCPPELIGNLIETIRACHGIAAGAEISMEMDPGTFDEERLARYLELGITRVSMGVQSFDAALLEACGRAHSLEDVYKALDIITRSGLDNFSIDLISGLPGQTLGQWEHTLSEGVSSGAAHISVYDLQVEAGTAFGEWYTPGSFPLPQDDTCADMYRMASASLGQAGFDHYEISNYARPGFQSRHNRAYWENRPFLAYGNGAASHVNGRRFSRPRDLEQYNEWVTLLEDQGWEQATYSAVGASQQRRGEGGSGHESESLQKEALYDDIMLGIRLAEGLSLDRVADKYGSRAAALVERGAAEGRRRGWLLQDRKTPPGGKEVRPERLRGRLRLSDPDGFLFSNSVISSVFCELDGWRPSAEKTGQADDR